MTGPPRPPGPGASTAAGVGPGAGAVAAGLSIEGVSVRYGATLALDRVSLEVAPGETVAVVGPSGSGKSTLLRAIAGLEPLVAGEVRAGGRPLAGVPVHQRDLGLMFQDHALFPHLDVAANVAFGLRMKRWPVGRQRERVGQLLELVGLAGLERRAVHELSGGEAQRVALARALAPEPALLMLDEPFGSLDRVLREQLTGEVRRLLGELGQTALHVTHDQAEAFALADRVAVLADGRLVQVGEPAALWQRPATAFVAEFLGHPNIWRGEVGPDGEVAVHGIRLGPVGWAAAMRPHGGGGEGAEELGRPDPGPELGPVPGPVELVDLVVPTTAVRPGSSRPGGGPELVVEVTGCVFQQGRYRVSGRVVGAEPELAIGFDLDGPAADGQVLPVAVDLDAAWPLASPEAPSA